MKSVFVLVGIAIAIVLISTKLYNTERAAIEAHVKHTVPTRTPSKPVSRSYDRPTERIELPEALTLPYCKPVNRIPSQWVRLDIPSYATLTWKTARVSTRIEYRNNGQWTIKAPQYYDGIRWCATRSNGVGSDVTFKWILATNRPAHIEVVTIPNPLQREVVKVPNRAIVPHCSGHPGWLTWYAPPGVLLRGNVMWDVKDLEVEMMPQNSNGWLAQRIYRRSIGWPVDKPPRAYRFCTRSERYVRDTHALSPEFYPDRPAKYWFVIDDKPLTISRW